ncbi:MAG: ATP-binding cassette domain-containing protein [Naasia sp.]
MSLEVRASLAARGLSFDVSVADGETVAVVGPNGAGKSTLLQIVAGLLTPSAGRVVIDGATVAGDGIRPTPHLLSVGYLPQDPTLFPHLDCRDNVAFGPRMRGAGRDSARRSADELLEAVGIGALADRRPARLSGGQAQRVALARALATDPRILLIDEPLASVDADSRDELRALIRRYADGRSTLVVSHDAADVEALADRTLELASPAT